MATDLSAMEQKVLSEHDLCSQIDQLYIFAKETKPTGTATDKNALTTFKEKLKDIVAHKNHDLFTGDDIANLFLAVKTFRLTWDDLHEFQKDIFDILTLNRSKLTDEEWEDMLRFMGSIKLYWNVLPPEIQETLLKHCISVAQTLPPKKITGVLSGTLYSLVKINFKLQDFPEFEKAVYEFCTTSASSLTLFETQDITLALSHFFFPKQPTLMNESNILELFGYREFSEDSLFEDRRNTCTLWALVKLRHSYPAASQRQNAIKSLLDSFMNHIRTTTESMAAAEAAYTFFQEMNAHILSKAPNGEGDFLFLSPQGSRELREFSTSSSSSSSSSSSQEVPARRSSRLAPIESNSELISPPTASDSKASPRPVIPVPPTPLLPAFNQSSYMRINTDDDPKTKVRASTILVSKLLKKSKPFCKSTAKRV